MKLLALGLAAMTLFYALILFVAHHILTAHTKPTKRILTFMQGRAPLGLVKKRKPPMEDVA